MCKLPILLSVISLLFSCSGCTPRLRSDQVTQIEFFGMAKGIETIHDLDADDVIRQGRDTIIIDKVFIKDFVRLINHLEPALDSHNIDCRSVARLHLMNGEIVQIAFGERWGIRYKGQMAKDDKRLFDLIDKQVYRPHDNEYWFSDDEKDIFRYAKELEFHRLP